jgi:hypothetical protein
MFLTEFAEKIKAHFNFNNFVFRKSRRLWHKVEKYGSVRKATDDNIIGCLRDAI